MDPHPDFAEVDWPRSVALGDVKLTPLSPAFVDEDLAAVLATAPLFGSFFGDWPEGLTREDNLIDLAWHEREFTARRSFSWIIRDASDLYIGCFYLYPKLGARGSATAALWLCDIASREKVAMRLKENLETWLLSNLPARIAVTWTSSPELE